MHNAGVRLSKKGRNASDATQQNRVFLSHRSRDKKEQVERKLRAVKGVLLLFRHIRTRLHELISVGI